MLIYAHKHHRYEDIASRTVYQFDVGAVLDVPENIGKIVQEAHPTKLCDVSHESEPSNHSCYLSLEEETQSYQNRALGTPPDNRVLTTTPIPARIHQSKVKNPAAYRARARQDRLAGQ